MTTMKEIAERAGVSISAVSLVLNNHEGGRVAPETADKIRALAQKLKYKPNLLARSLQANQTHILGFISEDVATTPYAGRLILGAQDAADAYGYALLCANVDSDDSDHHDPANDEDGEGLREDTARTMDIFYQYGVDGFLYAKMSNRTFGAPDSSGRPMVLVDCADREHKVPSIEPDEFLIGYDATRRLIQAGCSSIAYLGFPEPIIAQVRRRAGYLQALKEEGIPYDPHLDVMVGDNYAAQKTVDDLFAHAHPDGFFCFNDARAFHVYLAAARRGLVVGRDISVVGVDNHRMFAQTLAPRLTTVELPHYEMGYWAVGRLVQELEGRSIDLDQKDSWARMPSLDTPSPARIHCRLIEKESVRHE